MPKKDWNPGEILEISGYYWKTCTLHAAVKLGIFTVLGDDKLSAAEMAEKMGADADAVERLLNALTGMELLEKEGREIQKHGGRAGLSGQEGPWICRPHDHASPAPGGILEPPGRVGDDGRADAEKDVRQQRRMAGELSHGHVQPGLQPGAQAGAGNRLERPKKAFGSGRRPRHPTPSISASTTRT